MDGELETMGHGAPQYQGFFHQWFTNEALMEGYWRNIMNHPDFPWRLTGQSGAKTASIGGDGSRGLVMPMHEDEA
jgi:hypothetical protein